MRIKAPNAPLPPQRLTADQFRAAYAPTGKLAPFQAARIGHANRAARKASDGPLEAEVQAGIVAALEARGYTVQVTSQRRRKPPTDLPAQFKAMWYATGTSKGIADLLVRSPRWPRGLWLQMEVKAGPKSEWTTEQREQSATGGLIVVWTEQMAIEAADCVQSPRDSAE